MPSETACLDRQHICGRKTYISIQLNLSPWTTCFDRPHFCAQWGGLSRQVLLYHYHVVIGVSVCCVPALYLGIGTGLALNPVEFTALIDVIKNLDIPVPVMFCLKEIAAFPLCYHYLNGIRHLVRIGRHMPCMEF